MKSKMKIWKVEEGKYPVFKKWCNEMQIDLYDEIKQTLLEEDNARESFYGFEIGGQKFVFGIGYGEKITH